MVIATAVFGLNETNSGVQRHALRQRMATPPHRTTRRPKEHTRTARGVTAHRPSPDSQTRGHVALRHRRLEQQGQRDWSLPPAQYTIRLSFISIPWDDRTCQRGTGDLRPPSQQSRVQNRYPAPPLFASMAKATRASGRYRPSPTSHFISSMESILQEKNRTTNGVSENSATREKPASPETPNIARMQLDIP